MIERLEQQKRLTSNQWKLICTANLADLLDFFDLFLIAYVTAALTKEWSLTYLQGGAILMASGIGAPALRLARRSDRPTDAVHLVVDRYLPRHRHHGVHAGAGWDRPRVAVPSNLPCLCRRWQRRDLHDRPAAGAGIHPRLQARLG